MKGKRIIKRIVSILLMVMILCVEVDLGNLSIVVKAEDKVVNVASTDDSIPAVTGIVKTTEEASDTIYLYIAFDYDEEVQLDYEEDKFNEYLAGITSISGMQYIFYINVIDTTVGNHTSTIKVNIIDKESGTRKKSLSLSVSYDVLEVFHPTVTCTGAKFPHEPVYSVGNIPEGSTVEWYDQGNNLITDPSNLRDTGIGSHTIELKIKHSGYADFDDEYEFEITKGESKIILDPENYKPGETISAKVYIEKYDDGEFYFDEFPSDRYSLEYKAESDSVYSSVMPMTAGKYKVRPVFDSDIDYLYLTPEASFEIVSDKGIGSVIAKDINYGEKLNITVESKDYDTKKVILYYKLQSEDNSKYSKEEPDDPGKYTVKAVFPANDKFQETEATDNFEIKVVEGKAKLTVKDIKYGETPKPVIESEDYDKDKAKIYYKESGANDSTFTATIPKKPGSYIAQAIFPANKIFSQHIETCKFQITKADGEGKVTAKDVYVGMKTPVVASSDKNGIDKVKYEYKLASDKDSAYTTSYPTKPGNYLVRATFPETELYLQAVAETGFKISYLPNPGYSIAGVKGKNDFYTSDVTIKAPAGYQISTSFGTGYVDLLKYSTVSQSKYMYFKEIATGALSAKVEMPKYKIDSSKPNFGGKIKNNDIVFSDEQLIDINDDNLESVTVNGKPVNVSNGRASVNLASNGGIETYTVVAIDKAGNETSYTITVKSEWMEKGIIPAGEEVKLYAGTGYELEEGEWKVSGDATVYNGGMKVYVAQDTEITLTK